ncbi:MAG: M48 family metallopeptidase [Opitutaceae bacterium]|nr:M48 family metallopeptidase [Opitutaceae bacterium]
MKHLLLVATFALLAALLPSAPLHATGRNMEREAAIEKQLAQIAPSLVEPFRNARIAADKNDFATSEPLLRIVIEKAPGFDAGWRRLGSNLCEQGSRTEGLRMLEHALSLNRSTANLASLAYSLVNLRAKTTDAPAADRQRALALLQECKTLPQGDDADILGVTVQLALSLDNIAVAREAVARLEDKHPDAMLTHYFAAIIAANDEHWIRAEDEILKARDLGLSAETVQSFLDSGIHGVAFRWRAIRNTSLTVGGWALGLVTLFIVGWGLSRATLHRIEHSDPRVPISDSEKRLRKTYRVVLNLAGIYYYISLPIVLLLVIAAAIALVGGLFMIGYVPIYFTVMIIVGAIATIWSMLRSFFIRIEHQDPGEPVTRAEATALWQLAEEVAATLNTRPVDEIRLTTGTDLCVYERGTWRDRMNNRAQRILVLGAAVLTNFKKDDFRSVLAHEYGHFAHRDTAGGDIALRVRNDIYKFCIAMVNAEQNTRLNIAFHFLRLYDFLFRRISHGATRLQEVLADRVAAQAYGPAAFQGGLTHVIRQGVRFHAHANREIDEAIKAARPLQNLYAPLSDAPRHDEEAQIKTALTRPTTDDDTHPGPQDRFRLIAPIPAPDRPAQSGTAWDLFNDPDTVTRRLLDQVEKNIAQHRPYPPPTTATPGIA